jgi:hypothetical protein
MIKMKNNQNQDFHLIHFYPIVLLLIKMNKEKKYQKKIHMIHQKNILKEYQNHIPKKYQIQNQLKIKENPKQ